MPADSDLGRMTWTQVGSILSRPEGRVVALLPVGSTEAHGPHLPLATDVIISAEVARRAAIRLGARDIRALSLPPLAYTVTDFSADFPGTIGVSRETSLALVTDVCRSVLDQGFAAIALVNSHLEPGHLAVLHEAADSVSAASGKPVIFPDKTEKRWAVMLTEEFRSGACHAGRYEGSLVMAVRPDLVDEPSRISLPPNPVSIGRRIKEGVKSFREAGSDQAYFGDPAAATGAEGNATYEILACMVETAVVEGFG